MPLPVQTVGIWVEEGGDGVEREAYPPHPSTAGIDPVADFVVVWGKDRVRKSRFALSPSTKTLPGNSFTLSTSLVLSTPSSSTCLPHHFISRVRSSPMLRLTIIPVLWRSRCLSEW